MGYVIVLLLAALAGGLVYWASMRFAGAADAREGGGEAVPLDERNDDVRRSEREHTEASGGTDAPPVASAGTAYIPVTESRGSWQGRLGGVMGLVIAIVVAAATTALLLYEAGHFISKMLSGAANSG